MSGAASAAAARSSNEDDFDLLYLEIGEDGPIERRGPLMRCWNARFESAPPVRTFPSYQGQRNFPGLWWSATTGEHVGFESWLERDHAMMLDYSPQVTGFSSQPFWLLWSEGGKRRRHAPDFFARMADGTGVVIDVRADDRIETKDAQAFAMTGAAWSRWAGHIGERECWIRYWRPTSAGWRATAILVAATLAMRTNCNERSERPFP